MLCKSITSRSNYPETGSKLKAVLAVWRRTVDFNKVISCSFSFSSAQIVLKFGSDTDASLMWTFLNISPNRVERPDIIARTRDSQCTIEESFENSSIFSCNNLMVGRTQPNDIFSSFWRTSKAWVKGSMILTYSKRNSSSALVNGSMLKWRNNSDNSSFFYSINFVTHATAS